MKKIVVVTSTRAEYGLLRKIIGIICKDDYFQLCLIVTGTHLLNKYGCTINEIVADGFPISYCPAIMMESDSPAAISKTMGLASFSFSDIFEKEHPDMLLVLGDRYELLPICECAVNACIPIAHISGGETTEGAIDDCYRHAITKMSYLHFPGCEKYRQRIIQLGESPNRVFNFGDVGVEAVREIHTFKIAKLSQDLNFDLSMPYACVTFHPVTLELNESERQIESLLAALEAVPDLRYIFTYANADSGSAVINRKIDLFTQHHKNAVAFQSLGIKRYVSCLKYASMVIGNSSSGIVEAPALGIPTVNIGDRQKGRLRAASIIDCEPKTSSIVEAIERALSSTFKAQAKAAESLYGYGNTSMQIVNTIKYFLKHDKINLKKTFYDLNRDYS